MKFLRRLYFILIYALPAVLFCSYYPIIRLGSSDSMNFELSLPLIWLVLFDVAAFTQLIGLTWSLIASKRPSATNGERKERRAARNDGTAQACRGERLNSKLVGISDRRFFLLSLFPFYATISIFWSANPIRAVLTAGIIWLLFFAVFALIFITPLLHPAQNFRINLLKSFFISSAIICIFCWVQSILDLCGLTREQTLLCAGCVSGTFGFPHPSGLAIEPQFMGNLLLAPTLTALYFLVFRRKALTRRQFCSLICLTGLFSATLFFTFSRGAIYAFAVSLVVLFIFSLIQHQFRVVLIVMPVVTFIFTLTLQGVFNQIGPVRGSFCSGVTKSLHQLSLGMIDLRGACPQTSAQASKATQIAFERAIPEEVAAEIVAREESSTFDGYVAESTDVRLGLNSVALRTWSSAPNRILFGVGLGAAGTAMHAAFPEAVTTPKEIVQNQPISLLLELGLVGIALVIFSLLIAFFPQIFSRKFLDGRSADAKPIPTFWRHPALPLLCALIIAYLVTLQFFSGLPNALQIYLLPPLLYFVLSYQGAPIAKQGHKENYCNTEPVEV